jgi:uncharacterized protein (TIGR02271 family)
MFRSSSDVVIGLFPYASDARRALSTLRAHDFSADEVAAAFREPASTRGEPDEASAQAGGSGQWFGQLRQLYHGNDRIENTRQAIPTEAVSEARLTDFETMLGQLDLSPHDAHTLDHDLGRGGAIVTVKAGARNPEARILLEQRGAHILHGRSPEPASAITSASEPIVTSVPFSAPQQADPGHIQLFGEVLRVHKEKVSSGDVQVRKESLTHMETVQVPVTREHLVVEHFDESGRSDAEHAIRVPLSEERVHIDKDTVLREEYKVGKREVTQNEVVGDSVRRERLLIDDARDRSDD